MMEEYPRRVQARRGSSIIYKGKTLLSLIDPERHASKVSESVPIFKQTLYICPSPLFGYGLRELLCRITSDSAVLCVETDAALFSLANVEIAQDIKADSRLRIARLDNPAAACAFIRREFGPRRFRRTVLVKLSGGYALDSESYDEVERTLRDELSLEWSNAMTLVRLGRRYALNSIRNLALLPSSKPLDEAMFQDSPILVLGAGPSLDSVAPLLRSNRGYRVVCVDTALKPLLERGIEPDLVVALEAQHWNLRDFIGTSRCACAMALDLSSLPSGAFASGGDRYLFSVDWTRLRYLERMRSSGLRPPEIPPLGSVGLAAVAVALRAGTGNVVVGGLDFAYETGAYHARSAPSRLERLFRTDRLKSLIDPAPAFREGVVGVADKFGAPVRTDPALRAYRALFEREFSDIGRIFDAGGKGLPLGIRSVSLDEAERLLAEKDGSKSAPAETTARRICDESSVNDFIEKELSRLKELRAVLTGSSALTDIEQEIDDCDYLWAHFPECAGADGKRPPASDLAFLKRVRAEIDPFIKAFGIALSELRRG